MRRLGAAQQRPQSGYELGERERLGQVVVGAEAEPVHPVLDGGGGGQHQHPAAAARPDEFGAHLVAVPSGQVPVEHDHVIIGHQRPLKTVRPVEGDVHGHPLLPQPGPDRLGQLAVVLDHQHPHGRTSDPRARGPPPAGSAPGRPANRRTPYPLYAWLLPDVPAQTPPLPCCPAPGCTPVTHRPPSRRRYPGNRPVRP